MGRGCFLRERWSTEFCDVASSHKLVVPLKRGGKEDFSRYGNMPLHGHDAEVSSDTLSSSDGQGMDQTSTKSGSPLRRGLSKVSRWVHLARKALSASTLPSPSGDASFGNLHLLKDSPIQEDKQPPKELETKKVVPLGNEENLLEDQMQKALRKEKEEKERLRKELEIVKAQLATKEDIIRELRREVDKVKDVLEATSSNLGATPDILSTVKGKPSRTCSRRAPLLKKQGVSAESACSYQDFAEIQIQHHDKDYKSKQLIKDAIMENDFLKNLDSSQVREIVDCMYCQHFRGETLVIKEGDVGSHLYVLADGKLEVRKEDKLLGTLQPGRAFGELAILYNCTRTATVKAVNDAKLWVLDRKIFQRIMMKTGLQRQEDNINFLRSVPLLQNLSNEVLAKLSDVLEVDFYPFGEYIIREGETGDTFFIISSGKVSITKKENGTEVPIRLLERGDYFGERALLKEDKRTASVIAADPGAECLALDRDSFKQLIGDLRELQDKQYDDASQIPMPGTYAEIEKKVEEEYSHFILEDLEVIATLGIGGFGRVELVQYIHDRDLSFALKCLKKESIVATDQQHHILNEKKIMMMCRHPFICRLYRTFKNKKFVFMLMDACLGGEVWTYLRDRGNFDEHTTRFYTGCVVEAVEYLHSKNIIYRDLKPENLMLDDDGYVKLVDFGFSTMLANGRKSWTFCGTPEYVAPEVILNKGHDRAVDYWAIGVLMYELFTGMPPFTASDPMQTYNIILKGIDMIDFPRNISRNAQSLIKKLCRDNPAERLGYQKDGIDDIKKHKWFQGFHWEGLRDRTLVPPIVPKVENNIDTRNFDLFPRAVEIPADEESGWDETF